MKWILFISCLLFMNDEIIIFNKDTNNNKWYLVNDMVMGGLSSSNITTNSAGNAVFSGRVSTENNGGFAMVQMPVSIFIDAKKTKIVLKVKGDGKQYQFRLKSDDSQRYSYIQNFSTSTKEQEISLPLEKFYPAFRGRKLNLKNFSANQLKEVAILIGNKKNEKFSLEISKISIQ